AGRELRRERAKAERPGAQGILPDRVQNAAKARTGDLHKQQIGQGENGEAEIVEGKVAREARFAEEAAAARKGVTVVSAEGRERHEQEIEHLPEGERAHDVIDPA